MSIYTRSGDGGETSLGNGKRTTKADPRIEACGALDEATTAIGFARAAEPGPILEDLLRFSQHRMMNCAAIVASPPGASGEVRVSDEDVRALERSIDQLTGGAEFRDFVLPSGSELAVRCHLARTAVRRAERSLAALAGSAEVDTAVLAFVNRCSDALFAAAAYANAQGDMREEFWDAHAPAPAEDASTCG